MLIIISINDVKWLYIVAVYVGEGVGKSEWSNCPRIKGMDYV